MSVAVCEGLLSHPDTDWWFLALVSILSVRAMAYLASSPRCLPPTMEGLGLLFIMEKERCLGS